MTIETSKGALTISECHLVPSLAQSILSVPAITEKGGKVTFEGNRCLITPSTHGQPFCVAFKQQNDCFYLSPSQHSGSALRLHGDTPGKSAAPLTLWHQRLGDAGWQLLSSYLGKTPPHGVTVTDLATDPDCPSCWEGKMSRTSYPSSESTTSSPFQLVHMDLVGPLKPHSFHTQKKYVLVLVDDFTHFVWVYGLRTKSEAPELIQHWVRLVQNQFNTTVKTFRSDRGGEFLNTELAAFCSDLGIKQELTADKSPEQNGKAERMHQTLFNKARCMLLRSGLPPSFWLHAVHYAAWIQNRIPTSATSKVPYSVLTGKVPNVAMAKVFGCLSHIFLHPDNRIKNRKLSSHAEWGIFLGVREETKGWEFYLPLSGKLGFVTRNVKFHESKFLKQWRDDMASSGQNFDPNEVIEPHSYSGEFIEYESEADDDAEEDTAEEFVFPSVLVESPLTLPPHPPGSDLGPQYLVSPDIPRLMGPTDSVSPNPDSVSPDQLSPVSPGQPPVVVSQQQEVRRSSRTRVPPSVLTPRLKGQYHSTKFLGEVKNVVGTKYDFVDPICQSS